MYMSHEEITAGNPVPRNMVEMTIMYKIIEDGEPIIDMMVIHTQDDPISSKNAQNRQVSLLHPAADIKTYSLMSYTKKRLAIAS